MALDVGCICCISVERPQGPVVSVHQHPLATQILASTSDGQIYRTYGMLHHFCWIGPILNPDRWICSDCQTTSQASSSLVLMAQATPIYT